MAKALIEKAKEKFIKLVEDQLKRVERMKQPVEETDYVLQGRGKPAIHICVSASSETSN